MNNKAHITNCTFEFDSKQKYNIPCVSVELCREFTLLCRRICQVFASVHSYFGDLFCCKANVHSKFYISREARAKFDDIICYITWSSARSKLELQPRMATFLFSSNYKASTNSNYRKALLYFDKHISLYSYLSIYSPVVRAYAYFFLNQSRLDHVLQKVREYIHCFLLWIWSEDRIKIDSILWLHNWILVFHQ